MLIHSYMFNEEELHGALDALLQAQKEGKIKHI